MECILADAKRYFKSSTGVGEEVKKPHPSSMLFSATATAVSANKEFLKRQSRTNSKYVMVSSLSKLVPYQHHAIQGILLYNRLLEIHLPKRQTPSENIFFDRGGSRENSDILTTTLTLPHPKIYEYVHKYKHTYTKKRNKKEAQNSTDYFIEG